MHFIIITDISLTSITFAQGDFKKYFPDTLQSDFLHTLYRVKKLTSLLKTWLVLIGRLSKFCETQIVFLDHSLKLLG